MLNISIVPSRFVAEFWLFWTQTDCVEQTMSAAPRFNSQTRDFRRSLGAHAESITVSWNRSCHITDVAWNKTFYVARWYSSVQMQKHQLNSCIINVLYIHFLV